MSVMPALRRPREEDLKYKASLGYKAAATKPEPRVRQTVQWLTAQAALTKDPGSVPGTHLAAPDDP